MSTATEPKIKKFVLLGAGFWAGYQLAAWHEHPGVRCVGVCDPDRDKAAGLAARFGIAGVYTDANEALTQSGANFVDIVTPPYTHKALVLHCAELRLPVICQKPLAESVEDAHAMVEACRLAGVPLLVHENWRWQAPLRGLCNRVQHRDIGAPFRARLQFSSSFPVFDNQPFLATLPRFILSDIGTHILDVARSWFGEAESVYCQTRKVNPKIAGEDVATVMLDMGGVTVTCEMSYATHWRGERFPQTYALVEGSGGSLEVGEDYLLHHTRRYYADEPADWQRPSTETDRIPPPRYAWADPTYDLVMASMVPCQADLLRHLRGEAYSENTGAENLETLRLVEAAYESARTGNVVRLTHGE